MNFSNIYREYLTSLVEAQSKGRDEQMNQEERQTEEIIKAFIIAAKLVFESKNTLIGHNDELLTLASKKLNSSTVGYRYGNNFHQSPSKGLYTQNSDSESSSFPEKEVRSRPLKVAEMCGGCLDLNVTMPLFGAILDYLQINSSVRGNCIDAFNKAQHESKKRESELASKVFAEFKNFFQLQRKAALESKKGTDMTKEQFDKAVEKVDKVNNNPNVPISMPFFGELDPKLQWIDGTYEHDSSKFIYASELKQDNWLSMVMQIEQDIIANASTTTAPKTAEEQFKDIIDRAIKLEKDFNEIAKDKGIQELSKSNSAINACIRTAGGCISGMSLALGAFTYAFGAFIPGGGFFAEPLAKMAMWGRRAGKVISNAGSPLDDAPSKRHKHAKFKKDVDKKETDDEDVSVRHSHSHKRDLENDKNNNRNGHDDDHDDGDDSDQDE